MAAPSNASILAGLHIVWAPSQGHSTIVTDTTPVHNGLTYTATAYSTLRTVPFIGPLPHPDRPVTEKTKTALHWRIAHGWKNQANASAIPTALHQRSLSKRVVGDSKSFLAEVRPQNLLARKYRLTVLEHTGVRIELFKRDVTEAIDNLGDLITVRHRRLMSVSANFFGLPVTALFETEPVRWYFCHIDRIVDFFTLSCFTI